MKHWIFSLALMLAFVSGAISPGWAAAPILAPPRVTLPAQISSVTLNPNSVIGGTAQVLGTVTLNQQAPSGGVPVVIRSSNPAVAAVPPGVTIQPGATSATFIVQPLPVAGNPNVVNPNPPSVQISAQIGNSTPVIAQLMVLAPTLASLTFNPASVGGGNASTGTVTITGPAPAVGIVVTLSTGSGATTSTTLQPGLRANIIGQNPVTVPQQVTIPAGATSASFQVTTRGVSASTTIQINAAWGVFVTKNATLTLLPPDIASFPVNPDIQIGGLSTAGTINLTAPAPQEGMIIYLSGVSRACCGTTGAFMQCGPYPTIPSTVTVPGGSTSVAVPIATYPGYGSYMAAACRVPFQNCTAPVYATHNVNVYGFRVIPPLITQSSLVLPSSVKGGTTIQGTLQLQGKAMAANCGNQYPLASSNAYVAQVPPNVTVTPGASQATFTITTSAVSTAQTVTITVAQSVPTAVFENVAYNYSIPLMTVQATLTVTP